MLISWLSGMSHMMARVHGLLYSNYHTIKRMYTFIIARFWQTSVVHMLLFQKGWKEYLNLENITRKITLLVT